MDFNAIFTRIKNIIVKPADEWEVIKGEPSDKNTILKNYALPLIILVAIAEFLGGLIFTRYGLSIGYVVAQAIVSFIVVFLGIYISAIVINELASSFGSKKDTNAAFKLVIYSFTPVFIAQTVANLIPPLSFVVIFGLYSIYLIWLGLGSLMETPEDKKVIYVVVSAIIIFAVYVLLMFILGAILTTIFITSSAAGVL
jgi:hypothetical protein